MIELPISLGESQDQVLYETGLMTLEPTKIRLSMLIKNTFLILQTSKVLKKCLQTFERTNSLMLS